MGSYWLFYIAFTCLLYAKFALSYQTDTIASMDRVLLHLMDSQSIPSLHCY